MSTTWGRAGAARRRGVSPSQELVERLASMERERDQARDDASHCRRQWSKEVERRDRAEAQVRKLENELASAEDSEMNLARNVAQLVGKVRAVQVVAAHLETSSNYWALRALETEPGNTVKQERREWRSRTFKQLARDIDEALRKGDA